MQFCRKWRKMMKGSYLRLSSFSEHISSLIAQSRSRHSRAWRRGQKWVFGIAILLIVSLISAAVLRSSAAEAAVSVCSIHTRGEVQALILRVAGEEIGGDYHDFCTAVYSADGSVSAVSVDASAVNALSARMVARLERELSRFSVTSELPMGDLILPTLFSGRGPALKVHSTVYAAVSGEVKSTLVDAGINQTLHSLELEVKVDLSVVCMGREEPLEVVATLPLAEALVVGSTPGGLIVEGG